MEFVEHERGDERRQLLDQAEAPLRQLGANPPDQHGVVDGVGDLAAREDPLGRQGDVEVVFHGAGEKKKDLNTFYSGGMGGYGYRGWGGGMGTATTTVTEYLVGTLVVDIFDGKSKGLIWRGIAEDELSDKAEKNAKKRAKAMEKLFKDFPPGSVKK